MLGTSQHVCIHELHDFISVIIIVQVAINWHIECTGME